MNLSHGMFSHNVENFEVVAEVPWPLVSAMAVDKLDSHIISLFSLYSLCTVLYNFTTG